MAEQRNRYKQLERYMTIALLADLCLFVLYMIFAGTGVFWLKVFVAVLCFLISALCLVVLYFSQELLKARSIWMTLAAGAVVLVLLFSLILKFPSPNPLKQPAPGPVADSAAALVLEDTM